MTVPIKFLGDCVLTVAYLINRLPSPIIQLETPYYRLFGQQTVYNSLRTFGCLCFASTLTSERSKFHPRATPAVFIGYPPGVKGYKLFDIQHKKVFISRDVIFHESIFPFHIITNTEEVVDPFPDLVFSRNATISQPICSQQHDQPPVISSPDDDIPNNTEFNSIEETIDESKT